eukprot:GABV01001841.1.p1 GENE.GABV01001841.1~~GABV01001841.1.p1  ORF type:complete len:193 (-),score=50.13 GABV01001841.1:220-771(-)
MFSKTLRRVRPAVRRARPTAWAGSSKAAVTKLARPAVLAGHRSFANTFDYAGTPRELPHLKHEREAATKKARDILHQYGITDVPEVYHNPPPALLYELAVKHESEDTEISSSGCLVARSGDRTGRSPLEKRVVDTPSAKDVWWESDAMVGMTQDAWEVNRERALDWLNTRPRLYIIDCLRWLG